MNTQDNILSNTDLSFLNVLKDIHIHTIINTKDYKSIQNYTTRIAFSYKISYQN
jgi:hypothetical protein